MLKKFAILSLIVLISCGENETNQRRNEVPKALENKSINIGRFKNTNDLSEEIYQEIVNNNIELKNLENELENFNIRDTLDIFNNYDEKSHDYYRSAENQAGMIKDSILKNKIRSLLKKSDEKYKRRTTDLSQLIETIYQKQTDIRDCHTALKIILTIPIIEKYQIENLPKKSPFEKVIENQNILLDKIKKNTPNIK